MLGVQREGERRYRHRRPSLTTDCATKREDEGASQQIQEKRQAPAELEEAVGILRANAHQSGEAGQHRIVSRGVLHHIEGRQLRILVEGAAQKELLRTVDRIDLGTAQIHARIGHEPQPEGEVPDDHRQQQRQQEARGPDQDASHGRRKYPLRSR